MDLQRDYPPFKKLITRLCETLGKPCTDELIESWWKALRHVDLLDVEHRIDDFLARAGETTKFPRPSMMRDKDAAPRTADDSQNYHRGYWRSVIVDAVARELGLTMATLEPVIIANRESLGARLLELLDQTVGKDHDHSMTVELQTLCGLDAQRIAREFRWLRGEAA